MVFDLIKMLWAVALPCVVAGLLWVRLDGRDPGPGRLSMLLGASLVLGMLLAALSARLLLPVAGASVALVGGLALLLLLAVLAASGPVRAWLPSRGLLRPCWPVPWGWPSWLMLLLLVLLALRALSLGLELAWRPLFPWDAWSAWALRARHWYLSGEALRFVPASLWLEHEPGPLRHSPAAHYPELLPALQLWMVSAYGSWHEPVANLPWGLLALGLGLMAFGQLCALGLPAWLALGVCWALLSLPLLNTHVALAGYADLWVAAVACLAGLQLLRWRCEGGRGRLALGLSLALSLPALKLEGAIWMLCLLTGLALGLLPRQLRWPLLLGSLGLLAALLVFGRFTLPLPGLGGLSVDGGRLVIPGVVDFALSWQPVAAPVATALWLAANWHLLFWALPPLLIWAWRPLLDPGPLAQLGYTVLLGGVWLAVLFFATEAARWAEDFTSFSRLTLQLVPLVLCWAALLAARRAGSLQASGGPTQTCPDAAATRTAS